jgi:DEAD/DEAH box helicase domain-containing protein
LANLMTLCHACHRQAETAVRMRSGLTGLATVLGHLAPLFLMCDAHDVGLHPDPQSPLAEGQPAVIIYDMAPGGSVSASACLKFTMSYWATPTSWWPIAPAPRAAPPASARRARMGAAASGRRWRCWR